MPSADTTVSRSATWRDAEAETFDLLADLVAGRVPDLPGLEADDLRRVGYLADVALLLLDACDRAALRQLISDLRARLADTPWPPIPAIRFPDQAPVPPGNDMIADRWRISRGIDVGRFRAERAMTAERLAR